MKTPSKKNEGTQDESNVADLPLTKSNDDQHLIKSNKSEDGEQGKKKIKRNRECNDFRSNGDEDGKQENKMKKKKKKPSEESTLRIKKTKKKQKLIEGNTLNECNKFRRNGGEDGEQDKMKKTKKLSEESKHKENSEFKTSECEYDGQGKKMMKKNKKKQIEEAKLTEYNDIISNEGGDGDQGKTEKKDKLSDKRKSKETINFNSNEGDADTYEEEKKEAKAVASESPNSAHDKTPNSGHNGTSKHKRVTFVDEVETHCCDGLVRGKRFTPEEDEKIKASVTDYIDSHGLVDEGLDTILHCRSHPEVNGCWKEIAKVLPERPVESVYKRAHSLLENSERCNKIFEQYGPYWRAIADALGKSRNQVKDVWRGLKYTKVRKGHWSQDEYQNLFNLVEAIGHKLETRNSAFCCKKWYEQLTSPMVASCDWCDTDDYRLINALYTLDACCMEELDWDDLLEHRSGDACRKRWDQMVPHIGEHTAESFVEHVEILTKRFCPDLFEAREAFDNKPVIC
uniref:MYB family transcription factor n=1 Tax=Melilotus albus TaxID=47082 RepID=A0A896W2Q8_MELAB|nr:MYB family transcription factor [Melilotus albus]